MATPDDVWRNTLAENFSHDRWIADGNYLESSDIRLKLADTVIVLALSRTRCMFRVLRRELAHRGRAVQAVGCPEQVNIQLLRTVWRYPKEDRPLIDEALAGHRATTTILELTSPSQVRAFLDDVGS